MASSTVLDYAARDDTLSEEPKEPKKRTERQ